MLGHRKLNVEDYVAILKRRWWIIAVPGIIFPILGAVVTLPVFIPPQYVSQTLVLIEQQKVPDDYVRPVITEDLDSRLASMREQILSRSSIQPIIEKYNLYASAKLSMDDRIDIARAGIGIKPIHSDISGSNGLPGFYISFKASDPQTAKLVCGEITSLFVNQNIKARAATVDDTTDFLKSQLAEAERNLNDQDAKLATFQRQYFGKLPGDEANNLNLLSSLNTQLEAATQAVSNMEQQKSYMEAMLAQQSQLSNTPAVATQTPQAQDAELQALLAEESVLTAEYQPDHPDVKAIQRKIADLRKKMAQPPAPVAATPLPSSPSAPNHGDSIAVQDLRARLRALDVALQAKRKEQAQDEMQVRNYQGRVQSSPEVEEQYKELTRGYQTALNFHDALLGKINQSKMATELEHRQQGEQFKVMDEPNLPDTPTYPKRSVFLTGGLALGLGLGLLIVGLLEYKDTALRTERDIWAFTQLPTLAVIAWSGAVAHQNLSWFARLKRLFSRNAPKQVAADSAG